MFSRADDNIMDVLAEIAPSNVYFSGELTSSWFSGSEH